MKRLFLFILTGLCSISLFAQQSVSSSGGNGTGAGGTVSYTIGQLVYTTSTGSNGSAAQGVQQPYEISVVTAIEEAKDISLLWSAYPNPAGDYLKLSLSNNENAELKPDNLCYQLYDIYGKQLLNNRLDGLETTVPMQNLSAGTYILKVTERQGGKSRKELKIFKIIKH